MSAITPIRMPKWGLSMQEGTIVHWWKEEGAQVAAGEDLVDIETTKITNVFQSPKAGTLRRIAARDGEVLPVGALIAVMAESDVSADAIDAFVAEFQAKFVPGETAEEGEGLALSTVDAGPFQIRIGRAGTGDALPVLLVHGFSGDLNNWLFNIESLAAVRPVIAMDLPGHGASSKSVGDGSLATLADAVVASANALGVDRFHLAGHSLGGAVSARITADAPARVASLTLICPASLPGTKVSETFINGMVEARRARDVKPLLEMLFADPALVTKDMVEDMLRFKRLDGADEALAAIASQLLGPDDAARLARDLGRIGSATVIASRGDRIVGTPDEAQLPAGFKMVWIDSASHMPHLEMTAEVNAILTSLRD
ncbi:MAG TPA: acetoin dehydrogenase dihydrolipoyllysine-residue acetyltransferase subunit [Rhizomicrobium sp.]|nr:acetoin dehydrogenase dihydrolipoyllysine-residue acetyltransferase subunit [Rhizomicrobium sp.]